MPIQIHFFVGYLKEKELCFHLNQSQEWQKQQTNGAPLLCEVCWENQQYIGLIVPSLFTLSELKEKKEQIKTQLQFYCPKLNLELYSSYLFPQIFIS